MGSLGGTAGLGWGALPDAGAAGVPIGVGGVLVPAIAGGCTGGSGVPSIAGGVTGSPSVSDAGGGAFTGVEEVPAVSLGVPLGSVESMLESSWVGPEQARKAELASSAAAWAIPDARWRVVRKDMRRPA